MSIPDVITVDVSGLNIGDAIHVKDLVLGVKKDYLVEVHGIVNGDEHIFVGDSKIVGKFYPAVCFGGDLRGNG